MMEGPGCSAVTREVENGKMLTAIINIVPGPVSGAAISGIPAMYRSANRYTQ